MHAMQPSRPSDDTTGPADDEHDGEVLAAASRELKQPLNVISANAQLLIALPETQGLPQVMRAALAIQREAMNQSGILDTLFDHAPRGETEATSAETHPDRTADEAATPSTLTLAGIRVLLVDDSADALDTFAWLLEHEGLVVETCECGEHALEWLRNASFDVLVSDIGMPGMDGYTLLRTLRHDPRYAAVPPLPAIALTGHGRAQDVGRAFEAGFEAHVGKPADIGSLKRVIGEVIGVPGTEPVPEVRSA